MEGIHELTREQVPWDPLPSLYELLLPLYFFLGSLTYLPKIFFCSLCF